MGVSHPGIDVGPILTSAVNDLFPKKSALKRPLPIKKDACQTSHDFVIHFMHVNFLAYFLRCRDEVVLAALAYPRPLLVVIRPFELAITPTTVSFGLLPCQQVTRKQFSSKHIHMVSTWGFD